jgi:hypothetical protein
MVRHKRGRPRHKQTDDKGQRKDPEQHFRLRRAPTSLWFAAGMGVGPGGNAAIL